MLTAWHYRVPTTANTADCRLLSRVRTGEKGIFSHATRKFGKKKKATKFDYKKESWYEAFHETWSAIEKAATNVSTNMFQQIVIDLGNFVRTVKDLPLSVDEIPTGILLAGVNVPDHSLLIHTIERQLQSITQSIATIWSRDAITLKNLIEETVYKLINSLKQEDELPIIKKSQSTFSALLAWHNKHCDKDAPIVIIIPEFESFSSKILQDYILILNSYSKDMKLVLIFGVATTLHIVHRSLSYYATSKLKTQVFRTPTQVQCLSDILDAVVFSPKIPFKLTGKAFDMLIDMFLWYDFSVNSFLQSYKICLWRHFYKQNEKFIYCNRKNIKSKLSRLTKTDLRQLREVPSFKKYLQESQKIGINDDELKEILQDQLNNFHLYLKNFFVVLKCLFALSSNLPITPFGKYFREIYTIAVGNSNICETSEYKKTIQLLSMFGKEELILNINSIITTLNCELEETDIVEKLKYHINILKNASLEVKEFSSKAYVPIQNASRTVWSEHMKKNLSQKNSSEYKKALTAFINFLDTQLFSSFLKNPAEIPLNEIFCYNNRNEVNNYVRGSMKSIIHNALSEPHKFIGCNCCLSENDRPSTYPDLCLVYKIYLESGKIINLYDWLQAYLSFLDVNNIEDEQNDVDPLLHARFTRAVAELQLLGYVKSTKRKTDHVKRLT